MSTLHERNHRTNLSSARKSEIAESSFLDLQNVELSELSRDIIETQLFQELKKSVNSTIAYSELYQDLRKVTRYEHSIHSAKQAHDIENMNLNEYETLCLEVALLLHDAGHTLFSHTMDRIYNTMRMNRDVEMINLADIGFGTDYHEYHTALRIAESEELKRLLPATLRADVISILTYQDRRDYSAKEAEYNYDTRDRSLANSQVAKLFTLKEYLDRVAYIEQEFQALFSEEVSALANEKLRRFKASLVESADITNSVAILTRKDEETNAFEDLIALRKYLFDETVNSPVNAMLESVIERSARTDTISEPRRYKVTRQLAQQQAKSLFSEDVYNLTQDGENRTRCYSRRFVPLVTVDAQFLTKIGIQAFTSLQASHQHLTESALLKHKDDASLAELLLTIELREQLGYKKSNPFHVLVVRRNATNFYYETLDEETRREKRQRRIHTDEELISVIVAQEYTESKERGVIKKYKESGEFESVLVTTSGYMMPLSVPHRDTARAQKIAETEFIKRGWVTPAFAFDRIYNADIFNSVNNRTKYSIEQLREKQKIQERNKIRHHNY